MLMLMDVMDKERKKERKKEKKKEKKERKKEKRWRPTCRSNEPGDCMLVFPAQSPLRVYQGDR